MKRPVLLATALGLLVVLVSFFLRTLEPGPRAGASPAPAAAQAEEELAAAGAPQTGEAGAQKRRRPVAGGESSHAPDDPVVEPPELPAEDEAELRDASVPLNEQRSARGDARAHPRPRIPEAEAVRLSGRVVSADGMPVAAARVEFWPVREDGEVRTATETDEDGRFELSGLAPQPLLLEARAPGHSASRRSAFALVPGEVREGIELRLRRPSRVVGLLLGLDGQASPDRTVWLVPSDGGEPERATTGAAGDFRFEEVTPGPLRVEAWPSEDEVTAVFGAAATPEERTVLLRSVTVLLREGEEVTVTLDFSELEPVRLHGAAFLAGDPLAAARVEVRPEGDRGAPPRVAVTDAGGRFELVLARPGSHVFELRGGGRAAGAVHTIPVEVPAVSDFDLRLEVHAGEISGTVRDTGGRPLPGWSIDVRQDERPLGASTSWASVRTGPDGAYRVPDLAPGAYRVQAHGRSPADPGASDGTPTHADGLREGVVVEAGAVTSGVDFELAGAGGVRGRVVLAGSVPSQSRVLLENPAGRELASTGTAPDGTFRLDGLLPGPVRLAARDNQGNASLPVDLEIRAGELAEVELELRAAGRLVVRLVGPDGGLLKGEVELEGLARATLHFMPDRSWVLEDAPVGDHAVRARARGQETGSVAHVLAGETVELELAFE